MTILVASYSAAENVETALGSPDAPVTIIEYGSLTCGYCIKFHKEVMPLIKSRHIDSGHVRFIFRGFPTSKKAIRGAVAARCAGDQYYEILELLFENVGSWFRASKPDSEMIELAIFKGQANASLDHNVSINPDQYFLLIDMLKQIWEKTFSSKTGINSYSRRLFRSLEMAYHACSMPNKNNETIYDHGVSASLWVSSFEILAHDGNRSSIRKVIDLLGSYKWFSKKKISKRSFKSRFQFKINLVQKLYSQLYDLRNDFLHGNKITKSKILPFRKKGNKSFIYYAPLIYKVALLSYLQKKSLKKPGKDEFSNWFILSDAESSIKEIFLSIKR